MPAAAVDDQIEPVLLIPVQLNKVVAAAQRPDTAVAPIQIYLSGAPQPAQIHLLGIDMRRFPDGKAGGYLAVNELVQPVQLNFPLGKSYCLHATANIHPYQIGNNLVPYCHGSSDGASCASMHIRHNPNTAPTGRRLVA